jgi:general secretion pathway protein E
LNQLIIKILCLGCAQNVVASEVMAPTELKSLHLSENDMIRRHNPNGCDLCNRSGYYGRTLLLEVLIIEGNDDTRNTLYQTMLRNTAEVIKVPGVKFISRATNIRSLVREGLIDPRLGLNQLESLQEA